MKYRYFNSSDGETIKDAVLVTHRQYINGNWVDVGDFSEYHDAVDIAEYAAEEYQSGSEWHEGEREFAIVDEFGVITMVSVEIEYRPTFSGRVIKGQTNEAT